MPHFFSIIIATKKDNNNLKDCINKLLALDYPLFEIIILPDEDMVINLDHRIRVIPTGSVLPAEKRDIGSSSAKGEILAFLDDDTYPECGWLKNADLGFKNDLIACVCGPAVTPKDEPILNLASGRIYESMVMTGPARFRYLPLRRRFVDDFPSCNFLIRKDVFQKIGGFKTKFWPGEDTILCLEVVHKLNKKILYDPAILVYHHRRPLFRSHLKQIANYALHRGYFVKRFPKTSFKIGYFLPSCLVFAIFFSIIGSGFINAKLLWIFISYLLIITIFSFSVNLKLYWYVFAGIILSHFFYGINFIKGILAKKLKEE